MCRECASSQASASAIGSALATAAVTATFCALVLCWCTATLCLADEVSSWDRVKSRGRDEVKYLVLASKTLRPNTIYKVVAILDHTSPGALVTASISRDGVFLSSNQARVGPGQSSAVLLRIPPDNTNATAAYRLRVEGRQWGDQGGQGQGDGGLLFEETSPLHFSSKFLSITISTNKMVFSAEHPVRIRVVLLTTAMEPYQGIVDLFVVDPDGFVLRKWNSKELNVGVLVQEFVLPEYPKVGFWKIRVTAEGQTEELPIKVENHYLPHFELVVSMPAFILDTEDYLEATPEGAFITERTVKGNASVTWWAKKIDYQTPMYNDSVVYREDYAYLTKVANAYHNNLYYYQSQEEDTVVDATNIFQRQPFLDLYANRSFGPQRPLSNPWTLIRKEEHIFLHDSPMEPFLLYLDEVETVMGQKSGVQVRADATLTDYFYNDTQSAFAETRIIEEKITLRFVGSQPFAFKPGMIFTGQIAVMFEDLVPLDEDSLVMSSLVIRPRVQTDSGEIMTLASVEIPSGSKEFDDWSEASQTEDILEAIARESTFKEYRVTGVHQFQIEVPEGAKVLGLEAEFSHQDYGKVQARAQAYAAYSKNKQYIKVTSSTKRIQVGHYVVFHVKTNFAASHIDWLIVSKDLLLLSGREQGQQGQHSELITFSVVVSAEMAPGFHVVVHGHGHGHGHGTASAASDTPGVRDRGELVSDSLYLPVEALRQHDIELKTNQVKDHLKRSVEVTCRGDPGAVYMLATMRTGLFATQGGFTLTQDAILNSLHRLETDQRSLHRVLRTDREGEALERIKYFPSMDYEIDTARSFQKKNLVVFSNYLDPSFEPSAKQCNESLGERPCLSEGCVRLEQICDGRTDCPDGYDESQCWDEIEVRKRQMQSYRLSRQSRFEDFYDIGDGDWGWLNTNIDEDGEQFFRLELPETPDQFYFHVFSLSRVNGLGVLDQPVVYSTTRPLDLYCEAPQIVHRGETVGIRCILLNRTPQPMETVMILHGSDDYQFVHVEKYGYVVSYNPRRSSGDHHHFVWLRQESEVEVPIPIAPQIERGTLQVTIELSTQLTSIFQELEIEIVGEGSQVHRHTSVLLDLKSRANVFRFMNIIVDETPVIPYEVYRRFVAGSPTGHVTLSGDVIGPVFPGGQPVSLSSLFPTAHARFMGKGTEYHAFNLAANTWQLHYLRLTNQMDELRQLARDVFEQMNIEYTAVMRRFSSQGWFSNWDDSSPSVWLTAWVIRIFSHVSFQDWEDFIYIDPKVVSSATLWLLNYQTQEGAFIESERYRRHSLHKVMSESATNATNHVSLTAHVLITLEEVASMFQGKSKQYASSARQRALVFLERSLPTITDSFELSITALALAMAKSSKADLAYGKLMKAMWEEDGMNYWGRTPIHTNRVRYEFNRPFLEAKSHQDNDALSVEATSYALLTTFLMKGGGITFVQEKIVEWLNTMRLGDGAFIATVDTVVALQALVTYSYHSRIKDITDLKVHVELPDSNVSDSFAITGQNIAAEQRLDINQVWGHVNLFATGAGQAVAQLDVNYGVDYEPFKDAPSTECFRLKVKEFYHGRNKSEVTLRSCFSWTLTSESDSSGMAMLVVDTPTGYVMEQYEATKLVRSRVVPEMTDADVRKPGKTIWYFDRVPNETRCFEHTVRRYFAVANLTRTRQAILLEPLRPERFFIRTFNATSMYILSICEVCGSYQCPYCPFYSHATSLVSLADHRMLAVHAWTTLVLVAGYRWIRHLAGF